jgi:hypothetical protein
MRRGRAAPRRMIVRFSLGVVHCSLLDARDWSVRDDATTTLATFVDLQRY